MYIICIDTDSDDVGNEEPSLIRPGFSVYAPNGMTAKLVWWAGTCLVFDCRFACPCLPM